MQTELFQVTGMTSEKCMDDVTQVLSRIAGVSDVSVSLLRSQVTVQFDPDQTQSSQLEKALTNAGYTPGSGNHCGSGRGGCCGGCGGENAQKHA